MRSWANEHASSSEFAKLVGSDCQWHMKPAIDLARCELGSGNEAKFRQVCAVLASSIDEDETPSNRAHVLQRCVISPNLKSIAQSCNKCQAELNVAAQGLFIWKQVLLCFDKGSRKMQSDYCRKPS